MNERKILLESKSSRLPSRRMRLLVAVLGFLLLGHLAWKACSGAEAGYFSQGIVGIACLLASGWRRTLSLTPEGVLRESFSWGRSRSELFRWQDVAHVALAFRRDEMLAMFDRGGLTGLKVLFDRDQEGALRTIVQRCAPHAEISTIGEKRNEG